MLLREQWFKGSRIGRGHGVEQVKGGLSDPEVRGGGGVGTENVGGEGAEAAAAEAVVLDGQEREDAGLEGGRKDLDPDEFVAFWGGRGRRCFELESGCGSE